MNVDTLDLARELAPKILFDEREPFFPRAIGVTALKAAGPSPSFRRALAPPPDGLVLEYAIYWDWDIQHLYDLEQVWLFLDAWGKIADAEASFHGRYLKAILPDGTNLTGRQLTLYSQPGKHAFAPVPLVFRLLPDCAAATGAAAGAAGAEIPRPLQGRIAPDPERDKVATAYLRTKAFEPAWTFSPWSPPEPVFVPWEKLYDELPDLFIAAAREASSMKAASRKDDAV